MKIKLIICTTPNFLVGDATPSSNNGMSWYSKEELQYFKKNTLGHTLVFGLNTSKLVPLNLMKKDRNIEIMTPENNWEKIYDKYKNTDETIFICGGYSIYKWFIEEAIKHNFKEAFNIVELYISFLKSHIEIKPIITPLYLFELNKLMQYYKIKTINKYEDFDGYVFERN